MAGAAPFTSAIAGGVDVEKDDGLVVSGADVLNFEGTVLVTDNGNNKVTITVGGAAVDPFAKALFSQTCDPLFRKLPDGTVELLERCL